jgi:hypothetical protein
MDEHDPKSIVFFFFVEKKNYSTVAVDQDFLVSEVVVDVVDDDDVWMGGYHMDKRAVQTILVNNTTFN